MTWHYVKRETDDQDTNQSLIIFHQTESNFLLSLDDFFLLNMRYEYHDQSEVRKDWCDWEVWFELSEKIIWFFSKHSY